MVRFSRYLMDSGSGTGRGLGGVSRGRQRVKPPRGSFAPSVGRRVRAAGRSAAVADCARSGIHTIIFALNTIDSFSIRRIADKVRACLTVAAVRGTVGSVRNRRECDMPETERNMSSAFRIVSSAGAGAISGKASGEALSGGHAHRDLDFGRDPASIIIAAQRPSGPAAQRPSGPAAHDVRPALGRRGPTGPFNPGRFLSA